MTPKTTTANLLLWAAALALAVLLSALGALAEQLPGDLPINWRIVTLHVIQTILTTAPIVAAGFGLPRLGQEPVAHLVHQVGTPNARAALEDEAIRQQADGDPPAPLSDQDVGRLADAVLRHRAEQLRMNYPRGPVPPPTWRTPGGAEGIDAGAPVRGTASGSRISDTTSPGGGSVLMT